MRPFRSRPFRALRAGFHRLLGWVYYQVGAHEHARDRFERVLEIRGDDFTSYVFLGRLAYSDGDYAGWRRECELALRTAPERFAKLRHPFDLHVPRNPQAPTNPTFEDAGERASWRSVHFGKATGHKAGDLLDVLGSDGAGARASSEVIGGDDFVSPAERERFRKLEPVSPEEIRAADLDALADRFGSAD